MLTCEQLSIARGGSTLVENLGLTLGGGSLVVLTGANGSGKTTLLKTMAGLLAPYAGTVTWQGENIIGNDDYYTQLCYVGHQPAMKAELTVAENLAFWAGVSGTPQLLASSVHYFGLARYADKPFKTLSAGWRKRASLARLMVGGSKIWLLDEPFANMDNEGIDTLKSLLAVRCDQGGIVVIANPADPLLPFGTVLPLADFKVREVA